MQGPLSQAGSVGRSATVQEVTSPADDRTNGSSRSGAGFDLLFERACAGVVGLARRVLDRNREAPSLSDPVADEVAVEAFARARVHHLGDNEHAMQKVVGWTADLCLEHLIGHPGRVPLPDGARADDLLPADLLEDGVGAEWDVHGLALWELQEALAGARRTDRRVGVVCLGAGTAPGDAAVLLGLEEPEVRTSIARIGTRLADRRRVASEVESPLDARLGDLQ